MSELERVIPREDPLRRKLVDKINQLGYKVVILTDVNEGAFATIINNGNCTGPFAFFTGDPVPLKEDPIDWYKFLSFEPEFQAYHYCPILPSKNPTREDISEMLNDARQLISEAGRLRWEQLLNSLGGDI